MKKMLKLVLGAWLIKKAVDFSRSGTAASSPQY